MVFRHSLFTLFAVALLAQTSPSREALFGAIHRGSTAEVERLLKSGVSANHADSDGTPALMAATLFGNAPMVELLLKHGAEPNRPGPSGTTALMWAVPNQEKVRLLLAHGANVDARSESGRTPLLVAASYPGTRNLLQLLLAGGADLRAQDNANMTALALAMRSAGIEVVRFLGAEGLDLNTLSPAAWRAGLARNDPPTTEYLMARVQSPIPDVLITAAAWQRPALIAHWVELGADVNASNAGQYARTPLLTAVTSEAAGPDTLRVLLEHGANPNARTTENESPLDWAIYKGDRAKIQILEQHGAMRGDGPRREEIVPPARNGIADPRVSLNRSLARLLDVAPVFREKTPAGCISCHHNAMPALAAAAARQKGIPIDETRAQENIEDILSFFKSNVPRMMLGDPAVGGESITAGYAQMALAAHGHPLDTVTAAIAHWLLARQMPDGNWLGNGVNRPPSEYSTLSHTALAAGGLKSYTLPGREDQIKESLRRAQRWLLWAQPKSAEERAMRLMGLVWTDAPRDRVSAAVKDIRALQEPNGGWSQFGRTPADAYATGMSLYALHLAGMRATDQSYRKGVAFLLATQYQDGTWLVKTHAFPVQRYFESGFPFGRHQWISTAGTSWAALAIAQTLPDAPAQRR